MTSVIAIFGPTGSGKTDVAIAVARALGTEVVNTDPAQCYRGLPTLTNQPTAAHDAIALHRMIDIWPLNHVASFVGFAERAHVEIDELVATAGSAIACGGSGLYLQAALTRLVDEQRGDAPEHDPQLRAQLEREYDGDGGVALHARLAALDERIARRVHPNDRIRVVRALEVALRGTSIAPDGASHWDAPLRHHTLLVGLVVDRAVIRRRIDQRTRAMFERGLLDEVAALAGTHAEMADAVFSQTARKLHGLEDCLGVLRGDWSRAHAIDLMAARTRQYAKRQMTWARRWPGLTLIDASDGDVERIVADVLVKAAAS